MEAKALYMRRALELAELAIGRTAPNPMVGAVLVDRRTGQIAGEGYHHKAGEPHAEVMAIRQAEGQNLRECRLYVTLEPCSHHGKTPPCADLIIDKGIPEVIVAMQDPFPQVAGQGIDRLRRHGVYVEVGLLRDEAEYLNRGFLSSVSKHRPYITLKWAETADGFIDYQRQSSRQQPLLLSGARQQRFVHKLRAEHDGILIGGRTLRLDDPRLNNRLWIGPSPRPIVLSHSANIPTESYLHSQAKEAKAYGRPSILICSETAEPSKTELLEQGGWELIRYAGDRAPLQEILARLCERGIQSLLVEGGSEVLNSFIQADLYDHIERERSLLRIGQGIQAPLYPPSNSAP